MAARHRNVRLVRTAGALLSVQGVTWLSSLIDIVVVPRSLGSSDYGLMSTSLQLSGLLVLVASLGTSKFVVREVARNPVEGRRVVVNVLALRLTLWIALAGAALLVLPFVTDTFTARAVFALVVAGGTLSLVAEAGYSGLQGNQSLGAAALGGAIVGISTQLVLATVLLAGGDVVAAAAIGAAGAAILAIVILVLLGRNLRGSMRVDVRVATSIASRSVPFLAWDLGHRVYGSAALVMVAGLTGPESAGHLALALRIYGIPAFLTTAISAALLPALSAAAYNDREWFKSTLTQSARLVLIATVPMAVGMMVLAPEITALISGGDFAESAIPLSLLAVSIPAVAIHTVLGTGAFAVDRHRVMGVVAWVAAIAMVGLNLIAIPLADELWGNGAIGAVIVTLVTEAIVGALLWKLMWKNLRKVFLLFALLRALLAAAVMLLVVVTTVRTFGLGTAIPAGAIAYGVAGIGLRVFTLSEVRELLRGFRQSKT